MEKTKHEFFTKERVYNVVWYIIGCSLFAFITALIKPHINTTNKMITYLIDNFWLIFSALGILVGIVLLIYLKTKHTFSVLKTEISNLKNSIRQSTDNHAQHIYYIEKYYMKDKKYSQEDRQKEVPFGLIGDAFGYFKDKIKE